MRAKPWATSRRFESNWVAAFLAVLFGLLAGASVALVPFYYAFAAMLALGVGLGLLRSTELGLACVVLVATLLPFGTLPFKAVVTPNFLELALLALLGVVALRLLARPDESLVLGELGLPLIGFLGLTLFSFLLGSRGSPDSLTLHNYFKFVLAILFYFAVLNTVRSRAQARRALQVLIVAGAAAASIGIALWALSDPLALRLLVSLGRIGYPTSGRVLRYVEDDPSGVERAIGLSVDPNSFGGMLALVGALAATQMFAQQPLLPRRLLVVAALLIATATFLTQSRAALGGLIVAATYVATVRYRRLWWVILAAGALAAVLFVGLGLGERFVERVTEGVQFRDQANQMRLAEYRNAVEVIRAYPWFGIGFGRAPDLDLVAGVSSIYLAIAQRTGLIGLAAFLGIVAAFFLRSWAALRGLDEERASWLIGLQAAVAAALAVGLLDHYFFNIEFSHMVALFWGAIGLALALPRLDAAAKAESEPVLP
jgi:polysaccharide biosynthesis protein PslJ